MECFPRDRARARSSRVRASGAALAAAALILTAAPLHGQQLAASAASLPPPEDLAQPVREQLGAEATVVLYDGARIEFWWVNAVGSAAANPAQGWEAVPPGALIGAMRTVARMPDIRGVPFGPGVYTLRFARQPQDGDHLGVSPYREFLVVAPASEDRTPGPVGQDGATALGKKTQKRSHPAVLSIDPPTAEGPPGRILTTEEGHGAVVVAAGGGPTFGLILAGRIDH